MAKTTQSPIDPASASDTPDTTDVRVAAPEAAPDGTTAIDVVAIRNGYYDATYIRAGMHFTIRVAPGEKFPSWVVREGEPVPAAKKIATQLMTNVRQTDRPR